MTVDTTGLETSFQTVGQAIGNLSQQQQMANTALSQTLIQQRERATFGNILNQIATGQKQNQYNDLFKHIPVYDGEDKDQLFNWLDALESACACSRRDCHLVAQFKSTGRLRTAILSIGLE